MAAGNDLNLALRITADLNEARSAVESLTGDINQASAAASSGNAQWTAMVAAQDAAASAAKQHGQTQSALATEIARVGATTQQTSSSTTNYQNAVSQAYTAAESLKDATSDVNTDLAAQQTALAGLLGRIDPVVGAYERLDEMERQLSEFSGAGLIGGDDLDEYTARLNAMRDQVEKNAYAASEAGRKEAQAAREAAQAAREAAQVEAQARATKEAFIARLREQADTMNMTTAELLEYKAAQLGVTSEAAPFIQRLTDTSAAMNRGGLSAGQYAQAMRFLPMQITDVVTSLASGMPIWMVAIQQGGQIKDSFGGIGNTFRALTSLITPARLAMGGMVAAIAAVGIAAISVMNDQDAFNRAIAQTGNYAGVTAGQLEQMAQSGGALNRNYSQVRDILTGLVSSGKFSADTITSVSQAASAMAQITGQSADQVVSEFVKMSDSVSDWATNSNEKYHWLDTATYQRIRALEEQGRTEDAIELASTEYKKAASERLQELEKDLNWVAAAWGGVKKAAREATEDIKRSVSGALGIDSLNQQIEDLEKKVAQGGFSNGAVFIPVSNAEKERLASLKSQRDAIAKANEETAKRQKIEEKAIAASRELEKTWANNRTELDKEADAIEETRKRYEALWKTQGGRDTLRSRGVTSTDGQNFSGGQWDVDVAALSESTKQAKQYNEQLQKTLNTKKTLTELDKVEADIKEGPLMNATKAEQDKARALAKQVDAANAANKAARDAASQSKQDATSNKNFVKQLEELASKRTQGTAATRAQEIATRNLTAEQRKQAEAAHAAITAREFSTQNLQLQMEYMQASGNNAGASLLEVRNKYKQLKEEFTASGNTEGLNWLDKLLPMQEAKIRADALKKEIEELMTWRSQQETSIQAQVQGGLLTELDGRSRLIELHQQVGQKIEGYLPQLKSMATLPGDAGREIRSMLTQLEGELGKLKETGNELTVAFKDGLQSGLQSSIMGLAKGTMSLGDAVGNLALSIVNSMAQIAAQQLAMMATSSLMGAGGGAGGGMSGLFSSFFADGGHVRGPGTTTSDSIPAMLSDYEFVTRAAVVQQPGALPFLHDFNQRGIAALEDWAPRVRHATGGLAGIPAPVFNMPAAIPEPAQRQSVSDDDFSGLPFQQTLVLDSGELIASGFKSLRGRREFFTFVQANAPTLKQMLGVKQ
ncbi:phage tail length tape measure family protein [Pectobacterium aroidearum]|uniref:phage tail length tape measure family protein n=1 Tax=Pectobacterium aroidearum TaxID=1201031 RepID=UPI0021156EE0|nr:phage tail length tape measure family protein [Pectobacterium aroidearum]UUE71092.1 phage tail length tape measure family protein [Pectobacterium aroidearum]UUE71520.1 phage tail length tape measure family protein [Pectobacterium aroidearum]UUE71588.1 phage tail length tape measure family protein [Pectobacterium aroidearum]UUE75469.1 phage tail length tape measure family protein [Pectobacterium aroidearum]UUE75920.1 phage tail length tape measure family protein [Pectobacterium aroidearum]